jgi:hypothetical protein
MVVAPIAALLSIDAQLPYSQLALDWLPYALEEPVKASVLRVEDVADYDVYMSAVACVDCIRALLS